jgi:hypothetical protein
MDPANYEYNSMTTTQKLNMLEAQAWICRIRMCITTA